MTIKIVFFDLDGTIVDNQTDQVPISTIQSIKALHSKGIQVVLATGRSYFFTKSVGRLLKVQNFINCSGSYVRLGHEEVYKDPISQNDFDHLVQICSLNGDHLSCFGVEDSYSNGLAKEVALPILKNIDCHEIPSIFPHRKVEYMGMCLFLSNGNINDYHNISTELQFLPLGRKHSKRI
ncbi:HAD hydrolase family protein [Paenibacillus sp. UMB4589-SE434]|uniref:HAD hydrolase family protein n=1 Tax=Paenibacillus sp. UMB4589-SE434 TaxID=3046314 RepID=UPI002551C7DB|nr:HAD hydrolase family protein [Paenibacillus sp. UMB4589-SE434]MDK8179676.1 HAD hydrolase family protein [Paenibacillus sp. UMB4589-SE434]